MDSAVFPANNDFRVRGNFFQIQDEIDIHPVFVFFPLGPVNRVTFGALSLEYPFGLLGQLRPLRAGKLGRSLSRSASTQKNPDEET